MKNIHHTLSHFIDRRLKSIIQAPQMWGGLESIELQALQLIEVLAVAYDQEHATTKVRMVKDSYRQYIKGQYSGQFSAYLTQYLETTSMDEEAKYDAMAECLRSFYERILTELTATDPLQAGDVAVALTLDANIKQFSQPVIASYYQSLPRLVKRINSPTYRTGRVSRKEHIDLVSESGIDLTPPNGKPGNIIMAVNIQSRDRQTDMYNDMKTHFKTMYQRFLDFLNAVNATPTITLNDLTRFYSDTESCTNMALHAVSMAPTSRQGISKITLGGALLPSGTCGYITKDTAETLMPVIQSDPTKEDFSEEGIIRAADLDRRRFRLQTNTKRFIFTLIDESSDDAQILGKRVRVSGFSVRDSIFAHSAIPILTN